jgi:hypothetical protein
MKAETKVALGTCSECYENVFEGEEHTKATAVGGGVYLLHIDCCMHPRCSGNYEDVWCMDCGADYNNGRLL